MRYNGSGVLFMAHILIVEDDRPINGLIAKSLKTVGHSYAQVFNGPDAVMAASDDSFDLKWIIIRTLATV